MKKNKNIVSEPLAIYTASEPNSIDLIQLTRKGIPKRQAVNIGKKMEFSTKELSSVMHISERTLQRYDDSEKLDSFATEKILQLSALYEKGIEVFGDKEKFILWMKYPSLALGHNKPIDLLDTYFGFQLIFDELGRIEYGVFA